MPLFTHLRTGETVEASGARAARFRRSSNFLELTDTNNPDIAEVPPEPTKPEPAIPQGTVKEILEWAGSDPERIAAALQTEKAGKNRVTLIAALKQQ